MKIIFSLVSLAVSAGVGWVVYQHSLEQVEQNVPAVSSEPLAVEVMRPAQRTVEERVELVGSLEAGATVAIFSRVSGYITRLPFDVGDRVEQGQVLVELDDQEHRETIAAAKAALKVAEAQLQAQQAQEVRAEKEVQRQRELAETGAITTQERERAEADWNIAVAQRQQAEAAVQQAAAELQRSELALKDTSIPAAMGGYVAERYVETGDLAKPDVPLLRIVDIETVRTIVHVVERDYQGVQAGQQAEIEVDAFPQRSFRGKVVRKAPVLNPNTRTAAVQLDIPNPQGLLKPGMHARATIVFQRRPQATVIPVAGLVEENDKPAVYVVEGDPPRTRLHEVETGINDGEIVEVLAGLSLDDRVVTLGSRLVEHGQPVTPIEVAWPQTLDVYEKDSARPAGSAGVAAAGR